MAEDENHLDAGYRNRVFDRGHDVRIGNISGDSRGKDLADGFIE